MLSSYDDQTVHHEFGAGKRLRIWSTDPKSNKLNILIVEPKTRAHITIGLEDALEINRGLSVWIGERT
jgi:hypothetical protein